MREGAVLYVGKARSLKKRVASYARGVASTARIARMITETASMEFVTTETETEALLLETNLIKSLKPRFNVLMRDDKSFPYIVLTGDHPAPQLAKHRGRQDAQGRLFRPVRERMGGKPDDERPRAGVPREVVHRFGVRDAHAGPASCIRSSGARRHARARSRRRTTKLLVSEAREFLTGKSRVIKDRLAQEMEAAAADLEFERAARYRDRLAALSAIQSTQGVNPQSVEEADVFAIHEQAGQFCIEVFFFRTSQNWGNRAYFPKADRTMTEAEVLDAFLAQFYDDKPRAAPDPPVARRGRLRHPARRLVGTGTAPGRDRRAETRREARPRRARHDERQGGPRPAARRILVAAQAPRRRGEAFGIDEAPRRIEVYDNSHIMGTSSVGGMIVAGPEGFVKNSYRKFNMASEELAPGDDYAMMREMLRRRFSRLLKESPREAVETETGTTPDGSPPWPDLVLIDGGAGQLKVARETLAELGINDVPLVAIAKGLDREAGRETFFAEGRPPFKLAPRDPVLYFVQRLRDEAHRFAIGAHRQKRSKTMREGGLARDRRDRSAEEARAACDISAPSRRSREPRSRISRPAPASTRRPRDASIPFSTSRADDRLRLFHPLTALPGLCSFNP